MVRLFSWVCLSILEGQQLHAAILSCALRRQVIVVTKINMTQLEETTGMTMRTRGAATRAECGEHGVHGGKLQEDCEMFEP